MHPFPPTSVTPDPSLSHRSGEVSVTVLDAVGRPLADRDVVVAQRRHAFGFGNTGFDVLPLVDGGAHAGRENLEAFGGGSIAQLENLAELWLDLYSTATLPFYWGWFEPVRGEPDTDRLLATARWFRKHGVALKGHPLVWHTVQPSWLLDLPVREVEQVQRERIRRDVAEFAGLIDTWDAINEVVIMPVFANGDNGVTRLCRDIGRIATVRLAFEEARATNPHATLLLNDFDMSTAYECLIEGVLEAGVEIDVLGLQSHMHQGYWGEERTLEVLERFSRYGLPIHFTESTLLSGHLMPAEIEDLNDYRIPDWPSTPEGEERQADEMVRHYRTVLSHPSVQAITYWGLSDDGMWLGAPGGLVRKDGTPKPSYDALHSLVKGEWWLAPTTLRTDDAGRVRVAGWFGEYQVDAPDGTGRFMLEPGAGEVQVCLGG
jgi:GH35 family endo-1,4-beta-xylanase